MEIDVVSDETGLAAILGDWRALQARAARFPFSDPALFAAWWNLRGRHQHRELHLVTVRHQGALMALAPLVVAHQWPMRVLEWGGGELLDYCDFLLESDEWATPLWRAIQDSGNYDFGLLRDVHPHADCAPSLGARAQPVRRSQVSRIRLRWTSAQDWMDDALSPSARTFLRRAERRLEKQGEVRFELCRGSPVPESVLDALARQKAEWLRVFSKSSWMSDDCTVGLPLLHAVADAAAASGRLHLSWLQCGDRIIATHLGFTHNDVLHWYIPAYAQDWSRFSPGRLLLLKLIACAIDDGLSNIDFMRGEESYKDSLANEQFALTDFFFARSRVAVLARPGLLAMYRRRAAASMGDDHGPNAVRVAP